MKIRIRETKPVVNNNELNPLLKWGFVVVILYVILGGWILENNPSLYMLGLFFIFPVFSLIWICVKKILSLINKNNITIITLAAFWLTLLTLYISTGGKGFLGMLIIYSFFIAFIRYIFFLENNHTLREIVYRKKAKQKGKFKILLEDRNFVNHHNYFISTKNSIHYKNSTLKKRIINFIISSSILPFFMFISGISELISGETTLKGLIGISVVLFLIIVIFRGIAHSIKRIFTGTHKQVKMLYQANMDTSQYIEYRNKIFFY